MMRDWKVRSVSVWKDATGRGEKKNIGVPTSSFKTSSQTEIISSLPQLVHACTRRSSTRDRAAARRRRERIIGFSSSLLTYRSLSNSVPWSGADAICIGRSAEKPESCCLVKSIKMHAVCSLPAQRYRNRETHAQAAARAASRGSCFGRPHTCYKQLLNACAHAICVLKVDALMGAIACVKSLMGNRLLGRVCDLFWKDCALTGLHRSESLCFLHLESLFSHFYKLFNNCRGNNLSLVGCCRLWYNSGKATNYYR